MTHRYEPTGRVRRLNLPERKLCHQAFCVSHATHGVLYRKPTGTYSLQFVCEAHLLNFLAPEMWELMQKFAHGVVSMKEIYRDANEIFKKVHK